MPGQKKRVYKKTGTVFFMRIQSRFILCRIRVGLCLSGLHVDKLATFLALGEYYYTVDESEESVVLTHTHVETGMVNGATLTLEDVTGFAMLTAENLNTESFAF